MKNLIRILTLCFLTVVFVRCNKEPEVDFFVSEVDLEPLAFVEDSFLCTATKEVPSLGEIEWKANCYFWEVNDSAFGCYFNTYNDLEYLWQREWLFIGPILKSSGVFTLDNNTATPFASYSRTLADGDVVDSHWRLDESRENFIEILEYDSAKNEVRGRFTVHFDMHEQGTHGILYSEKINFLNAEFYAKIEK